MKRLGVLISGRGSNLQALINAVQKGSLKARISIVISNKPLAKGLDIAQDAGIPTLAIDPTVYPSMRHYEEAVRTQFQIAEIDYLILAGYMKLLGPTLLEAYKTNIINIHPSLLPKFKGINAQKQALEAGVNESGCTVHYVIPAMDAGPIIAQEKVPVLADDTVQTLADRILEKEHQLYPCAIQEVLDGKHKQLEENIIKETV